MYHRSIKTMDFFNSDFMLQTPHHEDQNQPILASCTSHEFHGVAHSLLGKRIQPMSEDRCMNNHGGEDDDLSDDEAQLGEKKRRLNVEQVRTLERNFELGNKLEPERKMQLARALGLRPRQIAIWFQNRRARSKTKQVERDYELLKGQFDSVVSENDALREQNQKLHAEIVALKTRLELLPTESINLNKDTEGGCCSNRISETENSSEIIKVEISTAQTAVDDRSSLISTQAANKPTFFLNSSQIKHSVNGGMSQLFQMNNSFASSRTENISCSKNIMDHNVKEESSLCNVFCNGMEDHAGFWPW